MPDDKMPPTLDEIRATFEAVRHKLACMNLCLDATIDDYPIGRRERGTRLDRLRRKMGRFCLFQRLLSRLSNRPVLIDLEHDLRINSIYFQFSVSHLGFQFGR
jgi:hypothetical protein